ncbi:hypothetical protein SmJEL517_g05550 [Synchytrium microbalum]|uniref:Calcium-transporting ATPase 2 n=1 Tax=Synchytrium microbalum TaxID=1806994 RepID=A0A507C094_9FUNG|nr:uncharacterized protein SmJEL517_g05550 [Synchytrium microbalum]TPX31005.1 hypothetical protein SmJEL517_g05550 [Synchytrium microbalum]
MSVLLETSLGDIVIDLDVKRAPKACLNFVKLCKSKYYNFSLFHSVQKGFLAQAGDPTATGKGGESVWGVIDGPAKRYFAPEIHPKLKHKNRGTVSIATAATESGLPVAGSQFFITLSNEPLDYLDGKHAVFGSVAEGFDVLDKLDEALVDDQNRPFRDIRIKHTIILEDPFDDPSGLNVPEKSPEPSEAILKSTRIAEDEELFPDIDPEELEKDRRRKEAAARTLTLEMVGDLPFAEVKPPENVLFVCKLNPVTRDEDLETIFSRFGPIVSCEIIRDKKTGESLCYAFVEFEEKPNCEEAYFKMDNVLIDDRRIHVDFSQSVSKLHADFMLGKRRGLEDGEGNAGLERKRQYRDQQHKDNYDLVFEHDGELAEEKSRKSRKLEGRTVESSRGDRKEYRDDGRRVQSIDSRDKGSSSERYDDRRRNDTRRSDRDDDRRRDDRDDRRRDNELKDLFDPKSLDHLTRIGGLQGLVDGLKTDVNKGLCNVPDSLFSSTAVSPAQQTDNHPKSDTNEPTASTASRRPLKRLTSQSSFALGTVESTPLVSDNKMGRQQTSNGDASHQVVAIEDINEIHAARISVYGTNVLPAVKSKSILELMWLALHDKTLILLSCAALVSLAVGLYEDFKPPTSTAPEDNQKIHWIEGFSILMAVMIVVLASSINDYQKEKQFQALNAKKEDRQVKVIRDGSTQLLSVYQVLVGDVLELQPGDVIAADGVLINGMNLKCDESAATGESDTIKKTHERDPFLLSGSKVTEGVGKYVVAAVGVHSFNGKTMMALRQPSQVTPLQVKLDKLAENIAKIGASIGIALFLALILKYVVSVLNGPGFGNDAAQESGAEIIARLTNILISAITLVVVAVPEGLPLAVTLALAYATTRMLKDNNLVRVLAACETMGNATTICSDKTGTLTQNKMKVVQGTVGKYIHFESEEDVSKLPARLRNIKSAASNEARQAGSPLDGAQLLDLLVEGNALNSSAFEELNKTTGEVEVIGSKTEVALLGWIGAMGYPFSERRVQKDTTVVQVYPFSSERKSMSTLVKVSAPGAPTLYRMHVKGASEIVLGYCNKVVALPPDRQLKDRRRQIPETPCIANLDSRGLRELNDLIGSYAEQSLRTICLAYREWSKEAITIWLAGPIRDKVRAARKAEAEEEKRRKASEQMGELILDERSDEIRRTDTLDTNASSESPTTPTMGDELTDSDILMHPIALAELAGQDLTCAAIVGIEDPLRPGVASAVLACQRAGVVVRMVTGDNVLTARAIAAKCGILTRTGKVMEGSAFRKLSEAEMDAIIPTLCVLARSSPTDKQTLVARLKARGDVVAVTGDGTNDGPALKMADVGFSMGIAGTEVAKEASSIILMDDNFESIVKAIMWGRAVNDSVKKFLQFQLTVNITAVVLAVVSSLADSTESSALTAVQLLWVNLIMDTLAALALATESPTQAILERPPEGRNSPLINTQMWKMILGQAVFQIVIGLSILFAGAHIFRLPDLAAAGGILVVDVNSPQAAQDQKVVLRTIFFNVFVLLQLFNQINARRIDKNINVFEGIFSNPYFYCIWIFIAVFQVIIVQFGTFVFNVTGLNGPYWASCILVGLLSLPVGLVLRLLPDEILPWVWWRGSHQTLPIANEPRAVSVGGRTSVSIHSDVSSPRAVLHGKSASTFSSGVGDLDSAAARENWQQTLEKVPELKIFTSIRGSGRIYSERAPASRDGRPPSLSTMDGTTTNTAKRPASSYKLSKRAATMPPVRTGGSSAVLAGIGIELAGTGFRPSGNNKSAAQPASQRGSTGGSSSRLVSPKSPVKVATKQVDEEEGDVSVGSSDEQLAKGKGFTKPQ